MSVDEYGSITPNAECIIFGSCIFRELFTQCDECSHGMPVHVSIWAHDLLLHF